MSGEIKCPVCGGMTQVLSEYGSVRSVKCASCNHVFSVRIHYVETPIPLGIKVFKALIDVSDPSSILKLKIKAKNVFVGKSNFYPEDLERQIHQGLKSWDLGFYAEREVDELLQKAEKFGLKVNFIPKP